MSTSTITMLAAIVAAAAVAVLTATGRKPARTTRTVGRASMQLPLPVAVATKPAVIEPPIPWWRRVRSLAGVSALAIVWGVVLAALIAGAITTAVLVITRVVR